MVSQEKKKELLVIKTLCADDLSPKILAIAFLC